MKSKALISLIIVIILLLVPLFYSIYLNDNGEMKIKDVLVTNDKTNILVYARVSHFSSDVEKAILAGVPTTFVFRIEFCHDNNLWFDKRLAMIVVKKNIKYDQVKKTFYLTSNIQKTPEGFQEFEEARRAISEINGIPIISIKNLKEDHNYYTRIKLEWENYRLPFYAAFVQIFLSLRDFETDWYRQPFYFQK